MTNTFVMNNQTGKAYMVTSDTLQSRNRRQLVGTGIRNPEHTQIAESHLTVINPIAALVCHEAEKIIRGKHKHTAQDNLILDMHKVICSNIIG